MANTNSINSKTTMAKQVLINFKVSEAQRLEFKKIVMWKLNKTMTQVLKKFVEDFIKRNN
jgi:hypothetical protein